MRTLYLVEGLISAPVENYKSIENRINEGTRNRTVAATQMNSTSRFHSMKHNKCVIVTRTNIFFSRAHTIVQINFTQKGKNKSGENTTKTSLINLVDLAGRWNIFIKNILAASVLVNFSERTEEAGTEGDRLKEGIVINKSLSTLGRCIKGVFDFKIISFAKWQYCFVSSCRAAEKIEQRCSTRWDINFKKISL